MHILFYALGAAALVLALEALVVTLVISRLRPNASGALPSTGQAGYRIVRDMFLRPTIIVFAIGLVFILIDAIVSH
jgi:hypothetical protein